MDRLRAGADLVIGNRFRGGIEPGAMPWLHFWLGNPVLSFLGRLFFSVRVGDFHCGLRGCNYERIRALDLRTTGMEFASELIVRAALAGFTIVEVPTTLKKDGRSRPSHLNTWRDGWRHLRFLLLFSPRWLFLYPGLVLLGFGVLGAVLLLPGPIFIGEIGIDIHTFIVACISILLGLQSITFSAIARRYGRIRGFIPASPRYVSVLDTLTLEHWLGAALVIFIAGVAGLVWCVTIWASTGFGPMEYVAFLRLLILSLTAMAVGVQLAFTAFLAGVIDVPTRS
jgi:hypothetical protein